MLESRHRPRPRYWPIDSARFWRAAAIICGALFFRLALSSGVYNATSPASVSHTLFGGDFSEIAHPWWLSAHVWLRKGYSVAAFTLVGFCAHRALGSSARPILRGTLLMAAYSLAIEVAQGLFVAHEPLAENAFDVLCGALGGWIAVIADRAVVGKRRRSGAPPG